jgi:hypothetical protein
MVLEINGLLQGPFFEPALQLNVTAADFVHCKSKRLGRVSSQDVDSPVLFPEVVRLGTKPVPPLKWNGCKTDGLEWDLLPLDFLRRIR